MKSATSSALTLTVVIPTFNERDNIVILIERIAHVLAGSSWEVIVVDDDSPDGTANAAKTIAGYDARVRCLHRVKRRGLAGAVLEGMMASAATYVAVIDADLQHDERLLPQMLDAVQRQGFDLAIGSRYLNQEDPVSGLSPARRIVSSVATWMAQRVLRARVSDPVSGFFMIRRDIVQSIAPRLSSQGFKILFDIIASQRNSLKIAELPYAFRERSAGRASWIAA